jgi:hypothetical protein
LDEREEYLSTLLPFLRAADAAVAWLVTVIEIIAIHHASCSCRA